MKHRIKFPLPHITSACGRKPHPHWQRVTDFNWWVSDFKFRRVHVAALIGTQPSVLIRGLAHLDWQRPIFVVRIDGVYYIRDGHHRVVRAIQRSQKTIAAMVLEL